MFKLLSSRGNQNYLYMLQNLREMEDQNDLILLKKNLGLKLSQLKNQEFNSSNLQQRGVADLIEHLCSEKIFELNSQEIQVLNASSKRSIEDLSIKTQKYQICLDFKSHDLYGKFCMPNLISIERAWNYLKNEKNHLWYIFIDYKTFENITKIEKISVHSIEELPWNSLAIQNLGKGQLQIKDNNREMKFDTPMIRALWLNRLKEEALLFIDKQIRVFQKRKEFWQK